MKNNKNVVIICIAMMAIVLAVILCGCSNQDNNADPATLIVETATETLVNSSSTAVAVEIKDIDLSLFPELSSDKEKNLEAYRQEVKRILSDKEGFLPGEQEDIFGQLVERSNYEFHDTAYNKVVYIYDTFLNCTSEYYFPVIYRKSDDTLVLWNTDERGRVWEREIYAPHYVYWTGDTIGKLHIPHNDSFHISSIGADYDYEVIWEPDANQVRVWKFGKIIWEHSVPEGSEYIGDSPCEGYIFKSGTEIFTVKIRFDENDSCDGDVVKIASDVEYVIDVSYCHSPDAWGQPLFLFRDGTLKCYISWITRIPGDPANLVPPMFEGGYHR